MILIHGFYTCKFAYSSKFIGNPKSDLWYFHIQGYVDIQSGKKFELPAAHIPSPSGTKKPSAFLFQFPSVNKCSFLVCLLLVLLLLILLLKIAFKCSTEVLSSVPKRKRLWYTLREKYVLESFVQAWAYSAGRDFNVSESIIYIK